MGETKAVFVVLPFEDEFGRSAGGSDLPEIAADREDDHVTLTPTGAHDARRTLPRHTRDGGVCRRPGYRNTAQFPRIPVADPLTVWRKERSLGTRRRWDGGRDQAVERPHKEH